MQPITVEQTRSVIDNYCDHLTDSKDRMEAIKQYDRLKDELSSDSLVDLHLLMEFIQLETSNRVRAEQR